MAVITRFQLKELKRETWFQLNRIESELQMMPEKMRARRFGMLKSKRRFQLLSHLLNALEQDGVLRLVENDEEVVNHVGDGAGSYQ